MQIPSVFKNLIWRRNEENKSVEVRKMQAGFQNKARHLLLLDPKVTTLITGPSHANLDKQDSNQGLH